MALTSTCLKWTLEEDCVLLQCQQEWETAVPKHARTERKAFFEQMAKLLPHRSVCSCRSRLWSLMRPEPSKRWSGYSAKSFQLHPTELAWLAGIFDGEGCIQASAKGGWHHGLYLCYGNDTAIIERVHALVPSSKVKVSKPTGVRNGIKTNHDVYAVYLYKYRDIYIVLKELLPYIVHAKKRLKVIDFLNFHGKRFAAGVSR